jgi:hypothetical protein
MFKLIKAIFVVSIAYAVLVAIVVDRLNTDREREEAEQAQAARQRQEAEATETESRWKQSLVDTALRLEPECEEAAQNGPCVLRGKALIWDKNAKAVSAAQAILPACLQATPADAEVTVFLVVEKTNVLTKYYDYKDDSALFFLDPNFKPIPGYRVDQTVAVASCPAQKAMGEWVVTGEELPAKVVRYKPEFNGIKIESKGLNYSAVYGRSAEPLARWVAHLPKAAH